MMILLHIYLASGILTGAAMLVYNLTSPEVPLTAVQEKLTPEAKRRQLWSKLASFPILVTLILLVWPFFLYMLWTDRRLSKYRSRSTTPAFSISERDLLRAFTIEQIEELERVSDPLGAAPNVPFGHLHESWQQFTRQLIPGDVVWSFSTRHTSEFQHIIYKDGYVIYRNGQIGSHYLTRSA